jgi:hypothetical protein
VDTNFKACSIPQSCSEVDVDLKKLNRMLRAAHESSIDIKDGYDFYSLALKEFNKENLFEAFLYCDRSRYELTSAINEAKIKIKSSRFHSPRTISYFFKLYGLYAVIFASLAVFLFSFLITRFSEVSILGVPIWSSLFAGLGASAQILTGEAGDLYRYDMTSRYKRFCYMTMPLLAMVFGYMAFLVSNSGFIVLDGSTHSSEFPIMFICILTGFFTKWLINQRLS